MGALLSEQFPQWADLPLERAGDGTVHVIYRLGAGLSVRLPRRTGPTTEDGLEHRWLPVLAPELPVEVPRPVARGRPAMGYPWFWSVHTWLEGDLPGGTVPCDEVPAFPRAPQAIDPRRPRRAQCRRTRRAPRRGVGLGRDGRWRSRRRPASRLEADRSRRARPSRDILEIDDATWLRSRGWAVSQALIALGYYTLETNAPLHAAATRWLAEVLCG